MSTYFKKCFCKGEWSFPKPEPSNRFTALFRKEPEREKDIELEVCTDCGGVRPTKYD